MLEQKYLTWLWNLHAEINNQLAKNDMTNEPFIKPIIDNVMP